MTRQQRLIALTILFIGTGIALDAIGPEMPEWLGILALAFVVWRWVVILNRRRNASR